MLPRPFSPYGVSKLAGEHLVLLYARNFGMSVAALRYFTVYGPRQRPDMAFHRFCRAMLRDEPIVVYGDGTQSRDFTYIDDAIEANVRAGSGSVPHGVYNVGGGSQVEVMESIAVLERALDRKARVRFEPRPPGDPLRTRADAGRLRADLGFAPSTPIERGLEAEARWAMELYAGAPS
jgi:UDP-glucose 4-epimerase